MLTVDLEQLIDLIEVKQSDRLLHQSNSPPAQHDETLLRCREVHAPNEPLDVTEDSLEVLVSTI